MKKIKLILVLCFTVAFFSCEDAYKIVQDGEFGQAATFRTLADMQLFLNETYDKAGTETEIGFTSIFTDETGIGSQNAGQNADLYRFAVTNQEGNASAIWLNHYILINYTNRFLRGAALITPTATELPQYNSMIAEARALRAFGHFQLLTYFSTDLKNDSALGVILMDRVPRVQEELPRNTNGEIFALIEADLQFADANILPNAGAKPWLYISKNYINAFRARMYAYRGNYTLALQYANAAITTAAAASQTLTAALPLLPAGNTSAINSPGFNTSFFGTATANPYRRMWSDLDKGEVIFGLDRSVGKATVDSNWYFNRTNLTGGPFHDMSRALYNMLDSQASNSLATGTPGDIRALAFIDPTSKVDQATVLVGVAGAAPYYQTDPAYKANDVLCIDKYPGKTGFDLGNDLKIFRLSEMYLIRAEANVAAGNLPAAAAAVKAIRDARNRLGVQPLPVYGSATAAWADILKERRLELCFEGHRYIDLKRLGTLAGASIDRFAGDCFNIPVCTLPTTDYRFTMPIPIDEIIGNSAIQQNPGGY